MSDNTITVTEIISELVTVAFGTDETITAYKIATVINGVFKATGTEKTIPTQMMYNYSRNGLINKVKGQKQYNRTDVEAFITKYTNKYVGK